MEKDADKYWVKNWLEPYRDGHYDAREIDVTPRKGLPPSIISSKIY